MQPKAVIKTAVVCAGIYLFVKFCMHLLSPFLLAVIISIMVEPGVKLLMNRLKLSRVISILTALLFFCFLLFSAAYFLIHNIYNEIIGIIKGVPRYYESLNSLAQHIYFFLKENFNIAMEGQNITGFSTEKILNELLKALVYLKDSMIKAIYSMPDIIMYISFSILAAFFICRDRDKIISFVGKLLPDAMMNMILKLNKTVLNIIKTELTLVLISTIQLIIGFIMLGIDYAVTLGIMAGILDILPLVGPGILFVPWIIYNLIRGNIFFAVSLCCLYIIIIITRQVMETRLMSGKLELHPLVILISIYIGLKFFGVLGAMLGPVIAMILKMVYLESLN